MEIEPTFDGSIIKGHQAFQETDLTNFLNFMPYKTICVISGNRGGKTASIAKHYVDRLLNVCGVEEKNKLMRKVRCMSSTLPEQTSDDEDDNAQYIELKKRIPPLLIEKDISARTKNLVVRRPAGCNTPKTVFEFRSSKQETQDLGKIDLSSVWHDEETPKMKREECRMRLMEEDGDEIFSLTAINPLCFDEETEIVTDKGWKKYDEILMSDKILSYSIERDQLEWKPMLGFYCKYYEGPMISIKQQSFNALVTPEHKWVVGNDRKKEELYLEKTNQLNTKHFIKRMTPNVQHKKDNPYYTDEFIALVGWVATDGSIVKSDVSIYQSKTANKKKCDKINKLLEPYPGEYRYDEREYGPTLILGKLWEGNGICCRWSITGHLRLQLANIISVPKSINQEFICSLSERQLQILWDAMVDGDGHKTKKGYVTLKQVHNWQLVDDFALIGTLLGRIVRAGKENYSRGVGYAARALTKGSRQAERAHIKSSKREVVDYKGFVWCPSTENKTVVMRRNGCVSISGNTWLFSEIWQRAEYIARSAIVAEKFNLPMEEYPNKGTGIAGFQMATDDNPVLTLEAIERIFADITDPDDIALRRYGVFKQISGRIHKTYDPRICYLPMNKWFPGGIPYNWLYAIGIDYHESRTPWSIGWLAASPEDEWFLFQEAHPAIDGPNAYNTYDIAKLILRNSGDYIYQVCLIDPLANKKQPNTGTSATDDLNYYIANIRRDEGIGTNMYFQGWDTKGTTGRDEISKRFKNSVRCRRPFNNSIREHGKTRMLPTLWISKECPKFHKSLLNWCYGEYVTASTKVVNDPKPQPQQKNSHDCMCLECLGKDRRLIYAAHLINNPPRQAKRKRISVAGR